MLVAADKNLRCQQEPGYFPPRMSLPYLADANAWADHRAHRPKIARAITGNEWEERA